MKSNLIFIIAVVLIAVACTPKESVADQNKAVMKNMINDLNQPDWADKMAAYMPAEEFENYKEVHSRFRTAFPDYHYSPEVIAASGDTVVTVGTVTVTHQAALDTWFFKGVEPTGKQYNWKEIWVMTLKEGKVTWAYSLTDNLDLLNQLGIVFPPQPATEEE